MFKKLAEFWTRFGFYVSLMGALALIAGAAVWYRARLPYAYVPAVAAAPSAVVVPASPTPTAASFALPLPGEWITPHAPTRALFVESLGTYAAHCGVDISGVSGEPVRAAAPGKISALYKSPQYGGTLEIEHPGGYVTRYGGVDLSNALVPGQTVSQGETIAILGDYPCAESHLGVHLHFEILQDGICINPESLDLAAV